MNALLSFASLFKRQSRQLIAALALSLVTLAAGIVLLGVSGWFLGAAAIGAVGLLAPSSATGLLAMLRIFSRYGEKLAGHQATLKLLSDLRQWLFARLFPLLPLRGRGLGRADLVSRLCADVEALDTAFLVALGPITTALLVGIAMSLGLAAVLPAASLLYALCFVIAAIVVPAVLIAASRRAGAEAVTAKAALRQAVLDGLDGHRDLVLFGETGRVDMASEEASVRLGQARGRLNLGGALASAAVHCAVGIATVGTLLCGISALRAGLLEGPVLVGLVLAVVASFEASAVLVRSATRLASSAAAAERLRELADAQPAISEPPHPTPLDGKGLVRFEGVTFGYDRQRPVLTDASFTVAAGQLVAIVGSSGAGKSTIAQLLARLCDPQEGIIRLDGVDLRSVDTTELHRHLAVMMQDAPVFLDSVRSNLLIGRPDADDAALWQVLRAVRLDGMVAALPEGLDALLGEAGQSLSAGQARRLCLARTLLSPAKVIVLDEPTSGLDRETEAAFLLDLPVLAAGRTMIVITHASLPTQGFDAVLRLRAGQLNPIPHAGTPFFEINPSPQETANV